MISFFSQHQKRSTPFSGVGRWLLSQKTDSIKWPYHTRPTCCTGRSPYLITPQRHKSVMLNSAERILQRVNNMKKWAVEWVLRENELAYQVHKFLRITHELYAANQTSSVGYTIYKSSMGKTRSFEV